MRSFVLAYAVLVSLPCRVVNPVNGVAVDQTFSFTFSDADGYADISAAQVIFGQTLSASNTCYFTLQRGVGSGTIYLVDNDGINIGACQ